MAAQCPVLELVAPKRETIFEAVNYERMVVVIAETYRVDEAKEIHDRAKALRAYYRQANDHKSECLVKKIRYRAERRGGQTLDEMLKSGERDAGKGGDRKSRSDFRTVKTTLRDLGLTKQLSSLWQRVAQIPEERFEWFMADDERLDRYERYRELASAGVEPTDWQMPLPRGKKEWDKFQKTKYRAPLAQPPFVQANPSNWWKQYWNEIPTFIDLKPVWKIEVLFADEEDIYAFEKLIGRRFTAKDEHIWFPEVKIINRQDGSRLDS